MPADFTEYVNLEIFDKEPGDIYRDSIELARLTLPEFNIRTGTPEDAIFQAMAYVSALNIAAINRLPDRLMAGVMGILGYQRQEAIPAEVDVEITLSSYDGGVVPSGTVFSYEALFEDEIQQFAFQTTEAVTIAATDLEVSSDYPSEIVTLTCLEPGIIPPLGDGVELSIVSSGTTIFSAITATPSNFANGVNEDIDEEYLSKAATYLRSLTSAITTSSQLDAYVLSAYPSIVGRIKTYDLTNGDDTSGDVTVYRSSGIINTYLLNDLATIETEAPHLFVVGDVIQVEILNNSASATFNGFHDVTGTTDTTISFIKVADDSASTVVSGSAYAGQDASGYVSVFAYGLSDTLTPLQKVDLLADIRAKSVAGLSFEILDPTLVTMEITGSITISNQYDSAAIQESIENVLISYLSPEEFPYTNDRIRVGNIISLITSVPGVLHVQSLSLTPTGEGWLPQTATTGSFSADILFRNKGSLPVLGLDNIAFTYTISDLE